MVLERLHLTNVAEDHFGAGMSRDLHDLVETRTVNGGAGDETGAQGMPRVLGRIEPDRLDVVLDQARDVRMVQAAAAKLSAAPYGREERPLRRPGERQPSSQAPYRVQTLSCRYRDPLPLRGLVGLRPPDGQEQPVVFSGLADEVDVFDVP